MDLGRLSSAGHLRDADLNPSSPYLLRVSTLCSHHSMNCSLALAHAIRRTQASVGFCVLSAGRAAPSLARRSASSFPSIPSCPGTQCTQTVVVLARFREARNAS